MTMRCGKTMMKAIMCLCMITLVSAATYADVLGYIQTRTKTHRGKIRWQPASKVYTVITKDNITLRIPARDVVSVKVQPPSNFEKAAALVRARKYADAIPTLEKIVSDYEMLEWDVKAARWLAESYVATSKATDAVRLCQKIFDQKPDAKLSGDLPRWYWQALMDDGRDATLNSELEEAIDKGTQDVAAMAQIMRGDFERKNGNFRDALLDGYLRAIVMYDEVRTVQPEALYKAAKCFEQLGELSNMEQIRRKLMEEYPSSSYTDRIKIGA